MIRLSEGRKRTIEVTLVPTEYLLWMNDQLNIMINDVKKMRKEIHEKHE